jgi:nucleoside phosphorylase
MIEDFRPEVISVVGIAGGIAGREGVALGDVVVGSYLHYAEFVKRAETGDLARYFAYDQPTVSLRESYVDPIRREPTWQRRIAEGLRPQPGEPKVVIGSIVAGEKVLGNPRHDEQKAVVERFSDAVAVDIESVGVARAVHEARRAVDYNPRLVVVRGISDLVHGVAAARRAAAECAGRVRRALTLRARVRATKPFSPHSVSGWCLPIRPRVTPPRGTGEHAGVEPEVVVRD